MSTSELLLNSVNTRPVKSETKLSLEKVDRDKPLTKKQRNFVEYILQGKSAKKSAELAGYTECTSDVAASQVMRHPAVIKELRRRADEYFKDLKIDTDWVLQRAYELANSNMLDYIEVREDGTFTVDLRYVTREMGAAIQELSYDPEGRPKIRLVDKKASVELLARIKKMMQLDDPDKGEGSALTIRDYDQLVQNITVNQQVNVYQSEDRQQGPSVIEGTQ